MRDAGNEVGYVFLSAKDESQLPGTEHCCSTALMIPNSNFILKTIFCRSPCRIVSLCQPNSAFASKGKPRGSTWPHSFVILTLTFGILILLTTLFILLICI